MLNVNAYCGEVIKYFFKNLKPILRPILIYHM